MTLGGEDGGPVPPLPLGDLKLEKNVRRCAELNIKGHPHESRLEVCFLHVVSDVVQHT